MKICVLYRNTAKTSNLQPIFRSLILYILIYFEQILINTLFKANYLTLNRQIIPL